MYLFTFVFLQMFGIAGPLARFCNARSHARAWKLILWLSFLTSVFLVLTIIVVLVISPFVPPHQAVAVFAGLIVGLVMSDVSEISNGYLDGKMLVHLPSGLWKMGFREEDPMVN